MKITGNLRNKAPRCILRKIILAALCLFCFTFPVFSQGDVTFVGRDNIGMDVSFQFGVIKFDNVERAPDIWAYNGAGFIGGRVGYYLGSIVFLDTEVIQKFCGCIAEPCFNEKTTILGGVRLGTIFDDAIGVFAKARAGAFGFNAEGKNVTSEKSFYPVFDIGVIVERYFEKNFFVRFDIGDWIIPFGDTKIVYTDYGPEPDYLPIGNHYTRMGTKHHFAYEIGLGFRF